jgi:hypothetical protein
MAEDLVSSGFKFPFGTADTAGTSGRSSKGSGVLPFAFLEVSGLAATAPFVFEVGAAEAGAFFEEVDDTRRAGLGAVAFRFAAGCAEETDDALFLVPFIDDKSSGGTEFPLGSPEGCNRDVKSLKDVDGRNAPNPSSIAAAAAAICTASSFSMWPS